MSTKIGLIKRVRQLKAENKALKTKYKELSDTVQINCNPPDDCNDPEVLRAYMRACFEKAMEYPK